MTIQTKKPVKRPQQKKLQRHATDAAFLSPSLIGVLIFFVLPFFVVFYYAMINNPISHQFVFLDNFKMVLQNNAFRQAAKNTLSFSVISVPLAVVLSLGLALLLDGQVYGKSIFRTFFLSPMMVPIASIVLIWQVLFHLNGSANDVLGAFGIEPIDWFKSQYNQWTVILLFLWKNLGYNMILFMASLSSIPHDMIEAAMLDGAGPWHRFIHIKLRYLSPTVLFVTILSLINSFKVFREVYLLTGDYPYDKLYLLQHFMNNTFRQLDYQKLSAAAILMAAVVVVIIAALFIAENVFGKDVEG
jgi:multiple sugar transport system permease protein